MLPWQHGECWSSGLWLISYIWFRSSSHISNPLSAFTAPCSAIGKIHFLPSSLQIQTFPTVQDKLIWVCLFTFTGREILLNAENGFEKQNKPKTNEPTQHKKKTTKKTKKDRLLWSLRLLGDLDSDIKSIKRGSAASWLTRGGSPT